MEKPKLNIIDRAIGFFSPKIAVERLKYRSALALAGSYNGGSLRRQSLSNWNPYAGDANSDIVYDLPTLRARSRDLAKNSPIGTAAINTRVSNDIGTGLSFQSNPDSELLGWSEEYTATWKKNTEAEFLLWALSLDSDSARSCNFFGNQALARRSMLESGDVIAITPAIKRNSPYSLTVQLIESDRLSNKDRAADSATLISGITIDSNGAPVRYSISNKHPGAIQQAGMQWSEIDAYGKNGRRNVIHLFEKKRPGQVRGVPYLAPVIEHLKQLARYSEAELQAAVVSAALAIFVKMDAEAFQTLFNDPSQAENSQTFVNRAMSWDGSVSTDLDGHGKAINLLPGEDISAPALGRPNVNFDPFFMAMLTQIGPALDIPKEVLIKSFSNSYSASRASLLDFFRVTRISRDFMATYFCEPIKELWFEEAVSLGRISAPGFFSDPRIRQAYTRCQWIGDSPGSIDPEKEANAAVIRMDNGITTLETETIAFNGGDWEANHRQRAKEVAMRKQDGLVVEKQPMQTAPQQS